MCFNVDRGTSVAQAFSSKEIEMPDKRIEREIDGV
jgi:hypothetical protein